MCVCGECGALLRQRKQTKHSFPFLWRVSNSHMKGCRGQHARGSCTAGGAGRGLKEAWGWPGAATGFLHEDQGGGAQGGPPTVRPPGRCRERKRQRRRARSSGTTAVRRPRTTESRAGSVAHCAGGVCAPGRAVHPRNERSSVLPLAHRSVLKLASLGPCGLVMSIKSVPPRQLLTTKSACHPARVWAHLPCCPHFLIIHRSPHWGPPGPPAEVSPACLPPALPAAGGASRPSAGASVTSLPRKVGFQMMPRYKADYDCTVKCDRF